jgi:hypothetical protein
MTHSPTAPAPADKVQENQPGATQGSEPRVLSPAARRALAEAAERRAEVDRQAAATAKEQFGRKGPEPVRYGDWEVKGLASDF